MLNYQRVYHIHYIPCDFTEIPKVFPGLLQQAAQAKLCEALWELDPGAAAEQIIGFNGWLWPPKMGNNMVVIIGFDPSPNWSKKSYSTIVKKGVRQVKTHISSYILHDLGRF